MIFGYWLGILIIVIILWTKVFLAIVKVNQWKVDGEIGTFDLTFPARYIWKRGIRVKAGDTGIFDNSRTVEYGASDEFSVGIHFRLEDTYGGHANTRLIAHQFGGGVGWKIEYIVGTGKIQVTVDDGVAAAVTTDWDLTDEDLEWWTFTYLKNHAEGLNLYLGEQLKNTASTVGMVDIHPGAGTDVKIGDAAATVAMMFGGFFLMSDEIIPTDLTEVNTESDEDWSLTGGLEIHTPGLSHDWGGAIGVDVDESGSQWKDASGNAHHLDMTLADSANSMAREVGRKTDTLVHAQLETLTYSRHGSEGSISVSEDDTVDVGDMIALKTPYNEWSGLVENVKKDTGGKMLKVRGSDEEKSEEFWNDVFTSRSVQQSDNLEDYTNLVPEGVDGVGEAGSSYVRLNTKLSQLKDALINGYGVANGILSVLFGDNVAETLGLTDFQLLERKRTMKDSCSDATVYGYGNANLPHQETIAGPLDDLTLTYKPVEIIKVEDATDGILYSSAYTVDSDNKKLYFGATTTDDITVDYTHRSPNSATASDTDIEEEIGKKARISVWVGYIGDTPLQAVADALLRGRYWVITIRPQSKKFFKKRWYVGRTLEINQTGNPFGINGDYFISKVIYEGSLLRTPRLELEQYDNSIGFPVAPGSTDMLDVWAKNQDETQHTNQGFHS